MQGQGKAGMDPLRRKRKGEMAIGNVKLKQLACSYNDGVSSSSFAPPLSFEECTQRRKRHKEKMMDEQLGSPNLHPAAAATVPQQRRGSCLRDLPGRGLKRKVGCIEAATQFGRNRKIESDYYMGQELGKGKFGLVRLCKSKATGEELACKTLPKNGEENVHMEVEIMQHLSGHPNVVTLRAVYEDTDSLHLVMEFCSGGRLLNAMSKNGCYAEHQAANLIKELVAVIKYCHEMGVIHRDIKPENILLTSDGRMKLADFGLSVHVANGQRLSGVVGSPAYVAPEVLAGTYSEKVDVWGAGVLLHALLIGVLPFRGESVEAIFEVIKHVQLDFQTEKWKSVSGPAKDLLSRMLSRDVGKRLSPEEVLRHPWIMFYTEPDIKLQARRIKRKKHVPSPGKSEQFKESAMGTFPSKPDRKREQGDCDLVDVLTAAILQIRISEPKRSRICIPSYAVPQECSSNLQTTLCTAF
ncbi:hypothetical protein KI387_032525 [Taxus chinensis]|uniref:Protein kinase domain-containing protein n=1 Tax=Taxus chinensis TaxID=29808 RepID=A0AA38C2M4_TAXCH|nr:hypothetical protein KI387_032525 [Taxus chinensis]